MLDLNLLQTLNNCAHIDVACGLMAGSDGNVDATAEAAPHPPMSSDEPCTCPVRTPPPARPDKLPFPVTPENNAKMETGS